MRTGTRGRDTDRAWDADSGGRRPRPPARATRVRRRVARVQRPPASTSRPKSTRLAPASAPKRRPTRSPQRTKARSGNTGSSPSRHSRPLALAVVHCGGLQPAKLSHFVRAYETGAIPNWRRVTLWWDPPGEGSVQCHDRSEFSHPSTGPRQFSWFCQPTSQLLRSRGIWE